MQVTLILEVDTANYLEVHHNGYVKHFEGKVAPIFPYWMPQLKCLEHHLK